MLPYRLRIVLEKYSAIWSDGYLTVSFTSNLSSSNDSRVVEHALGKGFLAASLSGTSSTLLHLGTQSLQHVQPAAALDRLRYLIDQEMRMYSPLRLGKEQLNEVCRAFVDEFENPLFFANYLPSGNGCTSTPVTNHAMDLFFCAVDKRQIGFLLYCDDE